ncbi:MFS transporter [Nocardioides sp. NPDC006303]|uniref:MFS transporter n=1 Tax=Nocardioides sp. NPDC006303 TaxID=3156747 RepID=UPI0033B1F387
MTVAEHSPRTYARWTRVGIPLLIIYLLTMVDRTNISIAASDIITRLELTSAATGVLLSAFFWGYVITMVPGGVLADRTSPVRVISWALAVVGVTAALTGIVENFTLLLVVRVALGLAEGVIFPAFAVLFLKWFPSHERGRAVAATTFAVPLSTVVAAPLGGWMIDQWNYQTMFILQGLPAIIVAIIFARTASDDPASDHRISATERDLILASRAADTQAEGRFSEVIGKPLVWIVGFTFFLWVSGIYGFNLWMPSLIKSLSQSGIGAVGLLSAIPFAAGGLGLFINSWLSDRSKLSRSWFIATPLTIGAIALMLQHYMDLGLVGDMVLLSFAGLGLFAGTGPWWSWMVSLFPQNQVAGSVGLINVFGNLGGIVAPVLLGVLGGAAGGGSSFYVLGYGLVIAAALVIGLSLRHGQRSDTPNKVAMAKAGSAPADS